MKMIRFGITEDFGKEYYLTLFSTKKYSFLQMSFDVAELSKWNEPPYIQISSGYGKLFSLLFTVSKFGFCVDLFGRNWRDELFYVQGKD